MDLEETITKTVKEQLKQRDWTQRRLASEMGVTEAVLSELLTGSRRWTMNMTQKFVRATGKSIIIGKEQCRT